MPIDPVELFPEEFHVVAMDQRNAGRSRGPLPLEDPWGAYVGDQLGLMDHLGIDWFLVIGCICCSYILKMIERSPERVIAGILMQPIGIDETNPGLFAPRITSSGVKTWRPNAPTSVRRMSEPLDIRVRRCGVTAGQDYAGYWI